MSIENDKSASVVISMSDDEFGFDRSNMTHVFAESEGLYRYAKRTDKEQHIRLFFDTSVIKVFINNGKGTMTSRVFIENHQN